MKKTPCKANSVWRMAMIFIVTMLLFAFVLPTDCIAKAEDYDWQKGYEDYIGTLDDDDKKDWYFGDDHLDIDGALAVLGGFFADENFDKEALKADPIIIGIIDSGIGFGYTLEDGEEKSVGSEYVYSSDVDYRLHPVFEDVLLKDADGKYIYKNVADKVSIVSNKDEDRDGKKDILTTMTSVDDGGVVVTASGNIALDMVDNTSDDHGTHVTGQLQCSYTNWALKITSKFCP